MYVYAFGVLLPTYFASPSFCRTTRLFTNDLSGMLAGGVCDAG